MGRVSVSRPGPLVTSDCVAPVQCVLPFRKQHRGVRGASSGPGAVFTALAGNGLFTVFSSFLSCLEILQSTELAGWKCG